MALYQSVVRTVSAAQVPRITDAARLGVFIEWLRIAVGEKQRWQLFGDGRVCITKVGSFDSEDGVWVGEGDWLVQEDDGLIVSMTDVEFRQIWEVRE